jgi:hypothetical protein
MHRFTLNLGSDRGRRIDAHLYEYGGALSNGLPRSTMNLWTFQS